MRITIQHVRKAGLCARGYVQWARSKGFTRDQIRDHLKNGMPIEEAEALNDPFANRVIAVAKAEAARGSW